MLKRLKLKTALIAIFVCCVFITSFFIAFTLLNNQRRIMMSISVDALSNELDNIIVNVENILTNDIEFRSETILNSRELNIMLDEFKLEDNGAETQKLVNIYLLNRYIASLSGYSEATDFLSFIVDSENEIYNLKYPLDDSKRIDDFVDSIIKQQSKTGIKMFYYPAMPNLFSFDSENIREEYIIPITRNLINISGSTYYGKQIFTLPEQNIYSCYKNSSFLSSGTIYIVDKNGNIISSSNQQMIVSDISKQQSDNINWAINNLNSGENIDNTVYVMNKSFNDNEWVIVAEYSLQMINKQIQNTMVQYIVFFVFVLIVICIIMVMLSNHVIKPIYNLMHGMSHAVENKFSKTVEEKGTKDTIMLIRGYNELLSYIDTLIFTEYEIVKRKQQAEMDALVTQINPHFLHNTLESIVWQSRSVGNTTVSEMAHYLGILFNISVNKGKSLMPVERELEHASVYIKLQNIRYNNKFNLQVSCDEDELLQYKTLKLILQPIIENSVLHGFKDKNENCKIYIHVEQGENELVFYIEDDGCGMTKEQLEKLNNKINNCNLSYDSTTVDDYNKSGNGIGVVNVHQRIQLYYGEEYGLCVQSTQGKGTCVKITIPLIK